MLKLYHGSNVVIDKIDLCLSRKGKDFGCGFYLNPNESQAREMAVRTAQRLQEGTPVVNAYLFDDSLLMEDSTVLSVKVFENYSEEWAEFILMNRRNMSSTPAHPYDIVIGPIADDTVGLQMRRFIQGYISIDRMMLRKRYIIETINDLLKNTAQIVHSRHRSVSNFIMNLISALGAYWVHPTFRVIV